MKQLQNMFLNFSKRLTKYCHSELVSESITLLLGEIKNLKLVEVDKLKLLRQPLNTWSKITEKRFNGLSVFSHKKVYLSIFIISVFVFAGCKNPFAPSFDTSADGGGSTLSNQTTVDGVFQNFQYAYTFQDTSIYGKLINPDFTFTYRDYDQGVDISWGRDEEMKTTNGLFTSTQRLDLIWNNIILSTQDSSTANIVRSFNLTVTFNPTDVIRINGRVNLNMKKNSGSGKWQITSWRDESNF